MTKLVNLDELAGAKRTVTYKGVSHEVLDLALEDFIVFQQDFDALLQKQSEGDFKAVVDLAEKITNLCVPTFQDLRKLNMRQTMALINLIADFFPRDPSEGNESAPTQTAA